MMANQIAAFHRRKAADDAAAEVAQHLRKFWEPRMRAEILAYVAAGGEGLEANAREGVLMLGRD